jgi:hypothetical protein
VSIRQSLNQKPAVAYGLAAVLLIATVAMSAQFLGWGERTSAPKEYYYTIDDGATYFVDSADRATPFEHEGKQAVRAHVYSCSSSGEFVAYLERYPLAADGKPYATIPQDVATEVKRPGEPRWVNHDSDAGAAIVAVTCPDGGVKGLEMRFP